MAPHARVASPAEADTSDSGSAGHHAAAAARRNRRRCWPCQARSLGRADTSWHAFFGTLRQSPYILLMPCLATLAMIAACMLGVTMGAQLSAAALHVQAQQLGLSTMDAFSVTVKLAQAPLHSVSAFVHLDPNWTSVKPQLRHFIRHQMENVPDYVMQVDAGFVGGVKMPPGVADVNMGTNLLAPGATLNRSLATLRKWPYDALIGPLKFNYGGWGVNIKHLIFVEESVNLTNMGLPDNPLWANCSECKINNPRRQLWGICSSNLDLSALRNGTDPAFARLSSKFRWKLWRTGEASELFDPNVKRYDIAWSTMDALQDPITLSVEVLNGTNWYLDIEPDSSTGWHPSWRLPLLVVMPIVCIAVGLLLLSREVMTENLGKMHVRSEALLYRMLPPHAVQRLREGKSVEATSHPEVTILFSDIVGFTELCARCSPMEVCAMLNQLYLKFDQLLEDFPGLYKVETIGDAYMVCSNLTHVSESHVDDIISFAIRMQQVAGQVRSPTSAVTNIRIGIHTGPVVAGVVGSANPRFCLFGDTVNTASRMESHGLPGKIHISSPAYERITRKQDFELVERGNINVKGKGVMRTYLIHGAQVGEQPGQASKAARRHSYDIPAEPLMLPLPDAPPPLYTSGPRMSAFSASESGCRPDTPHPQRAALNIAPALSCADSFEPDSPAGPRSQALDGCSSIALTISSYADSAMARVTPSFSLLPLPSGRGSTSSRHTGSFQVLPTICQTRASGQPTALSQLPEHQASAPKGPGAGDDDDGGPDAV